MKRTKNMIEHKTCESHELFLYAANTGAVYPAILAAIKNLQKKHKRGMYDSSRAVDLYFNIATLASKRYEKDYGYSFTVCERFNAALELEPYFLDMVKG